MSERPERVLVSLGSNLDPRANLRAAIERLAAERDATLVAVSRVWRTAAVGPPAPDYLNAAVALDTSLGPRALIDRVLRPIEAALGRVRGADRFEPRPIDLDLAVYGALVDPTLPVPDPEIARHAHLALPLADLAPTWREPQTGLTLAELAARLGGAPGVRLEGMVPEAAGDDAVRGAHGRT